MEADFRDTNFILASAPPPPLRGGGGGWHKAAVSDCLPLAAPIGLLPLLILTLSVGGGGGLPSKLWRVRGIWQGAKAEAGPGSCFLGCPPVPNGPVRALWEEMCATPLHLEVPLFTHGAQQ